jgi:transcriptional regulator with XRE-family HTH domain
VITGLDLLLERRRRLLTQWELARLTDISPYRISSVENDRASLTPDEEARLQAALASVPPERP